MNKIVRATYTRQAFTEAKIWSANLDFYQLFCSLRIIRSKKHVRRCLCTEFEENRLSCFWGTYFRSYFQLTLPHCIFFSIFAKISKCYQYNYIVLCMEFSVSIFISFGHIKHWIFPHTIAHIHTYILTDQFSKIIFLDSGDLKTFKSSEISILKTLTEYNTSINYRLSDNENNILW